MAGSETGFYKMAGRTGVRVLKIRLRMEKIDKKSDRKKGK